MPQERKVSELEQRLSSEVMSRAKNGEKVDTLSELSRRFVVETEEQIKRDKKQREKTTVKMARILFVPVLIIAVAYLFIILGSAIFLEEIVNISRYSEKTISLQKDPAMFWITTTYHLAIAMIFSWVAFRLGRATKWFVRRTPNTKIDRDAFGARH